MTFKDITFKNFKAHVRKYLSFFLCSCLTIMVFFMFSTVYFNSSIAIALKRNTKDVLNASIIAILFFSVLFLSYAYTAFTRSRKREFGLYMLLGMNSGAVKRLLVMENTIITSASLIAGLLAGSVLARLFFMVVVNFLKIGDIVYQFNIICYLTTIAVFITEFLIIILLSNIIAGRTEIIESFKTGRTAEKDRLRHPLFGIAGLILLVFSLGLKYLDTVGMVRVSEMSSIFVIICFTGLYFTVSQFGNLLEALIRKSKKIYYKYLPGISGIKHKIFRIKTVLFIITILSAITIYFIGTALSSLVQASLSAEREQPFHLAFVESENTDKIPDKELDQILRNRDIQPEEHKSIEFIETKMATNWGYSIRLTVISEESFKKLDNRQIKIDNGRYVMASPTEMFKGGEGHLEFKECRLSAGSQTFCLRLEYQMSGLALNKVKYLNPIIIIINNDDYEKMRIAANTFQIGRLHLINYKDWHKTGKISAELDRRLVEADNLDKDIYEYGDFSILGSRVAAYERIRNEGSMMLFLTLLLGMLFFIASSSIIYFKLFSEIDEEKVKYRKYFQIGILKKEYSKYVSLELLVLFFLPLVIGAAVALAYGCIDLKYSPFRFDSMAYLALVTVGYLVFQGIFYLAAKRKFTNEIIADNE